MPYINPRYRIEVDQHRNTRDILAGVGELNYAISKEIDDYLNNQGALNYVSINDVIGVLECAKLELYRRIAAPYEDRKIAENGDVYTVEI